MGLDLFQLDEHGFEHILLDCLMLAWAGLSLCQSQFL